MHPAAPLPGDRRRPARFAGAGLGAATLAQKHRSRVASSAAGHLAGLRLIGTAGSFSSTILIAGVCDWLRAGGGAVVFPR
jgi:hypothetical protein